MRPPAKNSRPPAASNRTAARKRGPRRAGRPEPFAAPVIHAAGWYPSPSGLLLPPSFQRREFYDDFNEIPAELRPQLLPMVVAKPPAAMDMRLKAYLNEEAIGLSKSTLEDLRAMAASIPFERSILLLARLAARVHNASADATEHLAIASEVFADTNVLDPIRKVIARNDHMVIFSEQLVYLMMRIVVELSPERGIETPATIEESNTFLRALLATSGVTEDQTREVFDESDPDSWIGMLVQHGEYSAKSDFLLDHVRESMLLAAISNIGPSDSSNHVNMDELHLAAVGLTAAEQTRLGLSLAALTHAFEDGPSAGMAAYVTPEQIAEAIKVSGLADKADLATAAIGATREQFVNEFSVFDAKTSLMDSLLWETRYWKTKPLLLLPNGGAVLLSPRFLQSWLSEGLYHRPLTVAFSNDKKVSARITRLYGELYGEHCLSIARDAFDKSSDATVSGDDPYVRGPEGKTPDVVIEIGNDLVLIEVTHSSLSAPTLVTGDQAKTLEELRGKLIGKVNELGRNAKRVLAGDASEPADPARFTRVWPIVVSGALPIQMPNLSLLLERETGDLDRGGRMQPLTLLDHADFETLIGLIEGGNSLVGMLERKTAEPFRQYDIQWWAANDLRAPRTDARPSSMEAVMDEAWVDLMETARPYLPELGDRSAEELLRETRGRDR